MNRALILLALALLNLFLITRSAAAASAPPNILLILVDDLGYGDLSSYGARDLKSPHLDALAARGMRWTRFYANCPVCSPTRAALLSGRYPDLVGVPGVIRTHARNNWGFLDPKATLLAEPLARAGYHTAMIGKWHLGLASPNTPTERGFDLFQGYLGDMMDDYYNHRRHGINYMRHNDREIDPEGHATDLFSQWAVDYLHARTGAPKPFFLYLAYNAPHTPIQPPDDWVAKVREREPGITEQRAKLVALIEHMDHGIGRVLEALRATDQEKDTLVLFTSDNGGQLSAGAQCGPWRGGKQDMYEGGLRVPFCAAWPGHIPVGSESSALGITMDLFPTLCEVARATTPENLDGVSLLQPLLGRQDQSPARDLFWVRREGGRRYRGQDYHAVQRDSWKLVQNHPFEPYQLYHLATDPKETTDLAGKEPQRYEAMSSALMLHLQRGGAVPWQRP